MVASATIAEISGGHSGGGGGYGHSSSGSEGYGHSGGGGGGYGDYHGHSDHGESDHGHGHHGIHVPHPVPVAVPSYLKVPVSSNSNLSLNTFHEIFYTH